MSRIARYRVPSSSSLLARVLDEAMRRSRWLTRGRRWALLGSYCLLGLTTIAGAVASIVVIAIVSSHASNALPLIRILSQFLGLALAGVWSAFSVTLATVAYRRVVPAEPSFDLGRVVDELS